MTRILKRQNSYVFHLAGGTRKLVQTLREARAGAAYAAGLSLVTTLLLDLPGQNLQSWAAACLPRKGEE
ncbi:Na(+)/H(+) Exchange Regulatory Cofactor Nhe-Rf1 [Manis pentadactyla]|nr:Na(+)/H(+) Exchange Regulatory Cofactor Nhe-Rf1 [Manis pentadactyla]